jgi:hypothetical protein
MNSTLKRTGPIALTIVVISACGLFSHLIGPGLLGAAIAILISGATFLDPLYAGQRLETIWGLFGDFATVQTVLALIAGPVSGLSRALLGGWSKSRWMYLIGPALGALIHLTILNASLALQDMAGKDVPANLYFLLICVNGPLLGGAAVALVRLLSGKVSDS